MAYAAAEETLRCPVPAAQARLFKEPAEAVGRSRSDDHIPVSRSCPSPRTSSESSRLLSGRAAEGERRAGARAAGSPTR